MRIDTSLAKPGRLDQDRLCVAAEAFRLIDEARRLTHEVPRLTNEPPRLNVESQRLTEQARALSDEAKGFVREALGVMREVPKLDLDTKRIGVGAAVPAVARGNSTLTPVLPATAAKTRLRPLFYWLQNRGQRGPSLSFA